MVERVVAYDMALGGHAADNVRRALDHVAHHEESGRRMVLFQGVQNFLRVSVFVPAVKGEIDDFLSGIAQIVGVILSQVLH